jgi:predicted TIM-barrel fold metal-dependent hydrolase
MKLSSLARDLYEEIAGLTIIDAHEHLPSEAEYLLFDYCGLNLFAGGYIWHDLESAGLSSGFKASMREGGDRPVDEWWPKIRPYWEQVQNTSYAKALRIAARDLFGIADINDVTIHELAAMTKADNTPGLYRRVLQERCHIRTTVTCVDRARFPDDPGLRGITDLIKAEGIDRDMACALSVRAQHPIKTLDDVVDATQMLLRADRADGAVGFKVRVGHHNPPDAAAAERELREALLLQEKPGPLPALDDYLFDKALDVAAEADLPVAVHTGYWGDFRELDPKHMFSFAARRNDVRFDMFHLGMPMVRDAVLMGKTLPNVSLNLTWCPIISQTQTASALAEIIDLVPVNKITAFGGDYRVAVHKTYGHLVLAREVVASVLAERIESGDFDRQYAMYLARKWFHDNPSRMYGL